MTDTAHLVVLGNGFDIDCGLPTQYGDFLEFITLLRDLGQYSDASKRVEPIDAWCDEKDKARVREGLRVLLKDAFCAGSDALEEWLLLVDRNAWIDYFTRVRRRHVAGVGENWVDFESEIAGVVADIELSMLPSYSEPLTLESEVKLQLRGFNKLHSMLILMGYGYTSGELSGVLVYAYGESYAALKKRLYKDLNRVRLALQRYLHDFVEKIDPKVSSAVEKICGELADASLRYVLSFNYTHTFDRVFSMLHPDKSRSVHYCYLHGEVRDNPDECDIVLGINEYRAGEKAVEHLEFIEFRKYFQRIFYGNDTRYLSWSEELAEFANIGGNLRMSLFGHSLAVTDKDVLYRFLMCPGIKTTSYYYSEEAFAQQIANMTALITPDELIARTGDNVRSLEFKPQ